MLKIIKFNILHFLRYFYLIKFNKFEIEIEILDNLIEKNDICFDIGACDGSYSRILAKYCKRVYAFEAEKDNYNYLKTVMTQKNIKIFNFAVSNKNGFSNLYVPVVNFKKNTAMSSLFYNNSRNKDSLSESPERLISQKVKTISLDTFVKKNKIKSINFIKIDVEGLELQILTKSKIILKELRPIFMIEILKNHKKDHEKVFKFMKKYNYFSFYLKRKSKKLFRCSYKDINKFQSQKLRLLKNKNFFDQNFIHNFFFFPKEKLDTKNFFNINIK